jgi:hypothetical protein
MSIAFNEFLRVERAISVLLFERSGEIGNLETGIGNVGSGRGSVSLTLRAQQRQAGSATSVTARAIAR